MNWESAVQHSWYIISTWEEWADEKYVLCNKSSCNTPIINLKLVRHFNLCDVWTGPDGKIAGTPSKGLDT